ncbi:MAG: DUF1906 domain-containing protein [Nocardioides sp.]|nr:DUF1906 domain-containing protein [Nocardioides sp.]
MHPLPRTNSRLKRLLVATIAAATASVVLSGTTPAQAGVKVTPGSFTGYGFDQCAAPAQSTMNTWMEHSPFSAVGIYIAGDSRGCRSQPNITRSWVANQLDNGWRLLPITLGAQASCSTHFPRYGNDKTISPRSAKNYFQARKQGRFEATRAVNTAKGLGIPRRSTLWYDLEGFNIGNTACRESALRFLHAWTVRVHGLGYTSGVYSSASSGIKMLDDARVHRPKAFALPDQVWIADWDGRANLHSKYVRPAGWRPHSRMKQYRGGHNETWGGAGINIDSNYISTGNGSHFPPSPKHCNGRVSIDKRSYPGIGPRQRDSEAITVLQCMLREKNFYKGRLNGKFSRATIKAIRGFQRSRGLIVRNAFPRAAWVKIHTEGPTRTVKRGSVGPLVRRLQRALTAATNKPVPVTGVFNARTEAVTKSWQRNVKLRRSGVINTAAWARLRAGRLG